MTVDLVITNGRVVTPSGVIYGGVAVDSGIIVAVGTDNALPQAKRFINAEQNYIIPGLIDPHVHMGSEEDVSLEDGIGQNFPRETDGAIHGGVTTFGHFVGMRNEPLLLSLETTIELGQQFSYVDFFCHAFILNEDCLAEQPELCRKGVTSFKHFFDAYKPKGNKADLEWISPVDEGVLFSSFEFVAEQDYPSLAMVHCEAADIINVLEERVRRAGRNDLAAWTESHPNFVEYIRIVQSLELAKKTKAPLYVVHISTKEGAELVTQARRQGYNIWGETTPHYLTHTANMEKEVGCWGKVNPSLKYDDDIERLWQGIRDGGITNIGTDCGTGGRTAIGKEKGKGKHNNIWDSRVGIRGGLEHMLPVMMTYGVHANKISIEDLVKVCSTNTAKSFGLYPKKGVLAPGSDADIVLVDPVKEATIDRHFYHCLCEVSIYEGHRVKGLARTTIVRGKVMMENYETLSQPGHGKYIKRGV